MPRAFLWKLATLCAFVAMGFGAPVIAQETADQVDEEAMEPTPELEDANLSPTPAGDTTEPLEDEIAHLQSDLATCDSVRGQLFESLTDLQLEARSALTACNETSQQEISALSDQLSSCRADVTLNRRTNIELNDRLEACEAASAIIDPQTVIDLEAARAEIARLTEEAAEAQELNAVLMAEIDGLEEENRGMSVLSEDQSGEIELLSTENASLQAEVDQLTQRLEELGFNLVPTFSYYRGDAYAAALRGSDLIDQVELGSLISVSDCAEALAWMFDLSGNDVPFTDGIWALDGEDLRICRLSPEGQLDLDRPGATDEAQVVFFQ
ncbi:MAG: hypothetical protein AAGL89_07305 [Pseudomonadota bacterium]